MKTAILKTLIWCGILIAIVACENKEPFHTDYSEGNVKVSYTNNTGMDILSVTANGKEIGTFGKGKTTNYISYLSFGADTGMPDIDFSGTVDGKTVKSTSQFYWCGTEKTIITEGMLDVSVNITDNQNGEKYFVLCFTKIEVPSPFINKRWKLRKLNTGIEVIPDDYVIIFKEDGTVEFPLHCNISGGTYTVNKNSFISQYAGISFSGFYPATKVYCGELYETEEFVVNKLLQAHSYSVDENYLTIECKDYTYLYLEAI